MRSRSLLPERVEKYVATRFARESAVAKKLRAETAKLTDAGMQIGADQGELLAFLVHLTGVRRALEIGTFTGYSALAVAQALPPGGTLIACDVSDEWTRVARRYWKEAGVADRITLRLGPAADTLAELLRSGGAGTFDLAFVDADKTNYDAYYEACLRLVRPGGLILVDNVLWGGKVADSAVRDADTKALRALNAKIRGDRRVESCLLTVGDGVMLVRRI
ncbi:MAG TPA: class I SAM-dependent methyltransferase [Gemmatimonadaceae bacterium]|nr:class I SAM-dependent methyltransferase [Gemmatimonadaceae bacterium]